MLTAPSDELNVAGATMLTRAVIELLARDQFYGELLTRLPRSPQPDLTRPFALAWQDNHLVLWYSPAAVAQTFPRFDSLQAGLKHVALHVVWQHPLRYRQRVQRQSELVTLATDLAVNQYVDGLPTGATGLATVQPLVTVRLPIKADSGTYLQLLRTKTRDQPPRGGTQPPTLKPGDQPQPSAGQRDATSVDDVTSWQGAGGQLTNPNLAGSRLNALTQSAWDATNQAGRGLVPGQVVAELARQTAKPALDWRQLLVRGLGQVPAEKRPSRARFNRRQPARMELPGQITATRLNVWVYVDHSGSISDATLQQLLAQVATLTQVVTATVTVKPFDAVVGSAQTYQANRPRQVKFQRQGGGGTVYQSIFDDLERHHQTNRTTLAIILTDGQGETTVIPYRFTNVIWLLAGANARLSVQSPVGRVVRLNLGRDVDGKTT